MTSSSFTSRESSVGMEETAKQVTDAFRTGSARDYLTLYPSLSDFYKLMESSGAYGDFLEEAKQEFADTYAHKLLPAVRESFEAALQQGKEKGIDWNDIRFIRIETPEVPAASFSTIPATIVIEANDVEHRLVLEKAIVVNGKLKVSRYIRFQ